MDSKRDTCRKNRLFSMPRGKSPRRGVLTLGLVICLVVVITLASLLWSYQYMVLVNQDVDNIADLAMESVPDEAALSEVSHLKMGKAQLNYAVMAEYADLWSGVFPEDNKPFHVSAFYEDVAWEYAEALKKVVDENCKSRSAKIYKKVTDDTLSTGDDLKKLKTITVGVNAPLTCAVSNPVGTISRFTENKPPTDFLSRLTAKVEFFRNRDMGMFGGAFSDQKSEVEKYRDVTTYYVACDPYVVSVDMSKLGEIQRSPIALPVEFFNLGDSDFLSKFYYENAGTPTITLTWELIEGAGVITSSELSWSVNGDTPEVSGNIYPTLETTYFIAVPVFDQTINDADIISAYADFGGLASGKVCFPVVDASGNIVDFVIFTVVSNAPETPPGKTTLTLSPTCVVTDVVTCNMTERKGKLTPSVSNTHGCNTSMSRLKISRTPIFK